MILSGAGTLPHLTRRYFLTSNRLMGRRPPLRREETFKNCCEPFSPPLHKRSDQWGGGADRRSDGVGIIKSVIQ